MDDNKIQKKTFNLSKHEIIDYILEYRGKYPDTSIKNQLSLAGVNQKKIEKIYTFVEKKYFRPSEYIDKNRENKVFIIICIFLFLVFLIFIFLKYFK